VTSHPQNTVYLDHAATSPVAAEALEAMLPYLRGEFANPSSVHAPGVRARRAVDEARDRLREALSTSPTPARPVEVTFTSGGTEANNLAVFGFVRARATDRVVTTAVEHPCVRHSAAAVADERKIPHVEVPTDAHGVLELERLADALSEKTTFVALIHGQNETGVLQPIARAAALIRARAPRAHLHVDAVQSFTKVPLEEVTATADSVALSAHKIGGPKGAGALVRFTGRSPVPLMRGGGQECDVRSGTENVAGIVGFGKSAEAARRHDGASLDRLADRVRRVFEELGDAVVLGADAPRLPSIVTATIGGVRGEVVQHHLEEFGVVIGTGSACHANKSSLSPTYTSLGLSEAEARSVVRVSLSHATTDADIDRFAESLPLAVRRVRELVG